MSDVNGLPMSINMVASLARHGHRHVLFLWVEIVAQLSSTHGMALPPWACRLRTWASLMRGLLAVAASARGPH